MSNCESWVLVYLLKCLLRGCTGGESENIYSELLKSVASSNSSAELSLSRVTTSLCHEKELRYIH